MRENRTSGSADGPPPTFGIACDEVSTARAHAGAGLACGGVSGTEARGAETGGAALRGCGSVPPALELDAGSCNRGVDAGAQISTGASPGTGCAGDRGVGEQFLCAESAAAADGSGLGHVPALPARGVAVPGGMADACGDVWRQRGRPGDGRDYARRAD